ncbi:C18orf8 [Bugula neritina]|uniref:C18orf8 n=1 Tax=Bugula neritina TaxID=10212 RepID=A0A7J7JU30_BUGNE|nr:C18orf8 [Bugula neritina]
MSIGLVNWSLWHKESKHLIISSGTYGNLIYPFQYENGTLYKYNKLEVELIFYPIEPKLTLLRRDAFLATIYNQVYIMTLKQDTHSSQPAELVLYRLSREKVVTKTHVLKFNSTGHFQVNIVDSLILVHHLQSKTTLLYDLKFSSVCDQQIAIHQQPLITPLPMKPVTQMPPFVPSFSSSPAAMAAAQPAYEMYSNNWIVFQPDVIIDAVQGCMWKTEISLPGFVDMISDKCLLIEVLLHRAGAKSLILDVVRSLVTPETASSLTTIGEIFNRLNQVYAYNEDMKSDFEVLSITKSWLAANAVSVIQQDDVYTHVFYPIFGEQRARRDEKSNSSFPISVMVEYIASLQTFDLPVHFYLYELLVNTLVDCGQLFRLHQFLQYHVMADSKHLACLLLSLQNVYPPAFQIALDMLKRLGTAHDEIVEVFLSKHQVLTAIRYLRSVGLANQMQPRKFLSVAKESGDPDIFYTTYKYFEDINVKQRNTTSFAPGDHCEEYQHHFSVLFCQ